MNKNSVSVQQAVPPHADEKYGQKVRIIYFMGKNKKQYSENGQEGNIDLGVKMSTHTLATIFNSLLSFLFLFLVSIHPFPPFNICSHVNHNDL